MEYSNMDKAKAKAYRALSPQNDAQYLLNRKLEHVDLSNKGKCADCGKQSKFLIVEKYVPIPCGECNRDKNPRKGNHHAWYYCGMCMVG